MPASPIRRDLEGKPPVGVSLRVEEQLDVAGAVGRHAAKVSERQVAEVLLGLQHASPLVVDVQEVLQVGEGVGGPERRDRGEGKGDPVAPGELEHLLWLEASLDVQMQFRLGQAADELGKARHAPSVFAARAASSGRGIGAASSLRRIARGCFVNRREASFGR